MIHIPLSEFFDRYQHEPPWESVAIVDAVFVAGGAVRNHFLGRPQDTDLDLFSQSASAFKSQCDSLLSEGFTKVRGGDKFAEFVRDKSKVQVIGWEDYKTIESLLDSFDFTICQFGLDQGRTDIVATPGAIIDAARGRLTMAKVQYPVATMGRFWKYIKAGFKPCSATYVSFLQQSKGIDVDMTVHYVD